jgi:hypothetical protein
MYVSTHPLVRLIVGLWGWFVHHLGLEYVVKVHRCLSLSIPILYLGVGEMWCDIPPEEEAISHTALRYTDHFYVCCYRMRRVLNNFVIPQVYYP